MDLNVLERMLLDENAKPMNLKLSLLEDITNGFSLDHKIGSGGFSVVYKGTVGKLRVAVKKLTKTHLLPESKFHKEVECLMKARHRNIVRFVGYCAETEGKVEDCQGSFVMADMRNWLLCFEYVPNGSLDKYITDASSGLEWRERFGIIKGICHGLHYLHKNRILHLDLKPANILLDNTMEPKIADFGLSRCLAQEQTRASTEHLSGTPGYLAPEFFSGKVAFASDIYSIGVIIMEIVTGVKGYPEDENVIESWMNRLEGDMQLEQVRVCTKIGIECIESDPKKRPVARHIVDMLDKTAIANETGMTSLLVQPHAGLLKEQSDRETVGKFAESLRQEEIMESPDTEYVAERLGNDHSQEVKENAHDWSSWEAKDTVRKDNNHLGTSIFSSNSDVLDKLNIFKIFKRNARKKSLSVAGIRTFTKREIKEITRNFSVMIRKGVFSAVYKGTLPNNTIVAVTTSIQQTEKSAGQLGNALQIETKMIHMNILKLVGCCLEVDLPALVHEFPAKGSLREILHFSEDQMLPLALRLDIAIGTAEGLRYMHSGGIRHGDVTPHTILLDEMFAPKISDFGISQIIKMDGSSTQIVTGSMGYLDPVYKKTGLLMKKSDVYSFGIVLLELITRKKVVYNNNYKLIVDYCKCYEIEKSGGAMFDKEIAVAEDISVLEEIGELAVECLNVDVKERPDMMEVTERLVMIRRDRRLQKTPKDGAKKLIRGGQDYSI
ncbi:hypothetical protein ACQ4PT_003751 [Festuca glaucescens]